MKRILFIEDDMFIRDFVSTKLLDNGYTVETAENATVAYNRVAENCPDLVLLDLELPGEHGFSILEHLRRDEQCKDLPIIIFSNNDTHANREKAASLGATAFYMKAATEPTELVELVRKHLAQAADAAVQ